jgi:signal transduction histidine kinase
MMNDRLPQAQPPSNSAIEPVAIELQRRLAFLELSAEDRIRLHQLAPTLCESADAFVRTFYDHLLSFDETAIFLKDPELIERLKTTQLAHFRSMLEADWNEDYARRRRHVGEVHAQVGISPEIFLGAYVQYLKHSVTHMPLGNPATKEPLLEQMLSLLKAVFLDIGLTLDAYFEQSLQSLRQAMDLVVKANSELRQFAQLTSHDLKTPLATVANLCDETLDEFSGQIPDEAANLVRAARDRVFRMSATIDQLLATAARATEDHSQEEFDARELIEELLEEFRHEIRQKQIEVRIQGGLPRLAADRVHTREAFHNVLSNAIKFIEKRPGRIVIEAEIRPDESIFMIADNGPGIPREELDRIFMPFRRLYKKNRIPGSGLGLYFARSLVERQGGRVWAESVVGEGSRFFISLPFGPIDSAAPQA